MKTKFVKVRDHWTLVHFLLLQFEEVDKEFAQSAGFAPELKIALRFQGRNVSCFAGYDLRDKFGGTVQNLSTPMSDDGTTVAFKEILHYVDNIRALPHEIDVENWRGEFFGLSGYHYLVPPNVRTVLGENPTDELRKVAYRTRMAGTLHLAIVNVHEQSLLIDIGTSDDDLSHFMARFLWIPLETATELELKGIDLGPLGKDVLNTS